MWRREAEFRSCCARLSVLERPTPGQDGWEFPAWVSGRLTARRVHGEHHDPGTPGLGTAVIRTMARWWKGCRRCDTKCRACVEAASDRHPGIARQTDVRWMLADSLEHALTAAVGMERFPSRKRGGHAWQLGETPGAVFKQRTRDAGDCGLLAFIDFRMIWYRHRRLPWFFGTSSRRRQGRSGSLERVTGERMRVGERLGLRWTGSPVAQGVPFLAQLHQCMSGVLDR